MDNTRLTIACEENREGGYEIDVTFERDSRTKFREAFISLDRPMPPYLIEENDINGVGAIKSATTSILSHIKNVIGKSMKTDSRITFIKSSLKKRTDYNYLIVIRPLPMYTR